MLKLRPRHERGHTVLDWLDSYHSFSFDQYFDPNYMGFGPLRVINEDRVVAAAGFPRHPHRDMEILTYVLEGELEHKDSMGNGTVIRAGEVQKMSAGSGVYHSEFNPSENEPVHLLQIWIMPERRVEPMYEQQKIEFEPGRMKLIANGPGALVSLEQDAQVHAFIMNEGQSVAHSLTRSGAWLQLARGSITVNGQTMIAGDGLALTDEPNLIIESTSQAEGLLFELNVE